MNKRRTARLEHEPAGEADPSSPRRSTRRGPRRRRSSGTSTAAAAPRAAPRPAHRPRRRGSGADRSTGFGVTRTVRPPHSNGSPVSASSTTCTCCSSTLPRSACSTPAISNSSRDTRRRRRPTTGPGTRCRSLRSAPRRGSGRAAARRRADHDTRPLRPGQHRRGDRERRGHPAVVEAVVFGEHERVEAVLVGPRELFERGGVDLARDAGSRAPGSRGAS